MYYNDRRIDLEVMENDRRQDKRSTNTAWMEPGKARRDGVFQPIEDQQDRKWRVRQFIRFAIDRNGIGDSA